METIAHVALYQQGFTDPRQSQSLEGTCKLFQKAFLAKGAPIESGPGQGHPDETVLLVSTSPNYQNETENFELRVSGDHVGPGLSLGYSSWIDNFI